MDNFEELKNKVEAYPNSSLFVPLADEYKKRGDLDEAINVLKKGLERQPSYTSARVALARIYLEKGLRAEAVEELETVLSVSPDNFLALKNLADTYCRLGRKDKAVSRYKEILKLNPEDEEAVDALKRLEGGGECVPDEIAPDMATELESLSMPPEGEVPGQFSGSDSPKGTEAPLEAGSSDDAEAFVEQAGGSDGVDLAAGEEDVWDVDDAEFDMGGLEFEPDGVYGDEESGEVKERTDDAGLDIGVDVVSGSEETFTDEGLSAFQQEPAEPEDGRPGETDILVASEKVGHEILNEPSSEEPLLGRESLVPSGGIEGDASKEYSGESFIGNDDENVVVTPAPGLETFEAEPQEAEKVPVEDKTVMMREPLAGMDEGFGREQDEKESAPQQDGDRTVIMEAPVFESEAEAVEDGVVEAVIAEEDKTVIMQASDLEAVELAEEAFGQADDGVVYGSEPFEKLEEIGSETQESEPLAITAEAGTIARNLSEGQENLINDPFTPPFTSHSAEEPKKTNSEVLVEEETTTPVDSAAEMGRADELIAKGEYIEARNIYSSLLSVYPEDKIVRTKLQELMMLLKVTGQTGELYNNGLESFHTAIMRRRDEFRKNT